MEFRLVWWFPLRKPQSGFRSAVTLLDFTQFFLLIRFYRPFPRFGFLLFGKFHPVVDNHSAVFQLANLDVVFIIVVCRKGINLVIGHTATALFGNGFCLGENERDAIVQFLVFFGIRYRKEFVSLGSLVQISLNRLLEMFCSCHNCYLCFDV